VIIDLNRLHHALRQVTGDMAIKFYKATPADLELWIKALRVIARAMEAAVRRTVRACWERETVTE
jgi:plasmid maintenance system antidote protein VapI